MRRIEVVIERDVPVPLPDGTTLRADVWRPGDGRPAPVLLQRTPYDKGFALVVQAGLDPARAVAAGYAVIVQDVRGRYASEGSWEPFVNEASDGAATVAWAAAQPFCDGRVAMYGGSYVGLTQLLAAAQRPPALQAMLPHVTAAGGWMHTGGAFELGFALSWARSLAAGELDRRKDRGEDVAALEEQLEAELAEPWRGYAHLPVADQPLLAQLAPYFLDWLARPPLPAHDRLAAIEVPALHLGGWHDVFISGTLDDYVAMRAAGRARQRLVVGPWAHAGWGDAVGEVIYGLEASRYALDPTDLHLTFFDQALNGGGDAPPVRIFVMGANRWRDEDDWPLARARTRRLHLRADAGLTWEPPGADEGSRTYIYDPADPVPTSGGPTLMPGHEASIALGPRDQRPIQQRPDVLVYATAPLERAVEVTGHVTLTLHAASSAPSTDWTAKLVDVQPDGRALSVVDGILRTRLDAPDRPQQFVVDVGPTSLVFLPGHRIGLELSSSNFPRFDRNPNTGGDPAHARASDFRTARQRIFHDAQRPSWLDLPIVEH